jgi:hypothetical protein
LQRVEGIARHMSGHIVEITAKPQLAAGGGVILSTGFSYDGSGSLFLPEWHQDLKEARALIPGDKVKLVYSEYAIPPGEENDPLAFVRCIKL